MKVLAFVATFVLGCCAVTVSVYRWVDRGLGKVRW